MSRSAELKRAKKEVRRRVLALRDAIPEADRRASSEAISERVLDLPELVAARTVMVFWSFGSEIFTAPLLHGLDARGVRIALPRIAGGEIEPVAWRAGDPMRETSFGALEPASGEVLVAGDVDVIVTPAVAFDRSGRRLGYGGGFYDRFLLLAPEAPRVGIGFAAQLVDEDLPGGGSDLRVDIVVTQDEVIRCASEIDRDPRT